MFQWRERSALATDCVLQEIGRPFDSHYVWMLAPAAALAAESQRKRFLNMHSYLNGNFDVKKCSVEKGERLQFNQAHHYLSYPLHIQPLLLPPSQLHIQPLPCPKSSMFFLSSSKQAGATFH